MLFVEYELELALEQDLVLELKVSFSYDIFSVSDDIISVSDDTILVLDDNISVLDDTILVSDDNNISDVKVYDKLDVFEITCE